MATFAIEQYPFGKFQVFRLLNKESGTGPAVIPGFGGIMNEYIIQSEKGDTYNIIKGYASAGELLEDHFSVFRSAKLSPYPNRIRDGHYLFNGDEHQLQVNFPQEENSIHGLILDRSFRIEDKEEGEDEAFLGISYDYPGADPGYPFPFYIRIDYRLHRRNGLTVTTRVRNRGNRPMPLGDGWHPYFTTGGLVDRLKIAFPSKSVFQVDERLIPTGERSTYDRFRTLRQIGEHQLDSCFELDSENEKAEIKVVDSEKNIEFTVWQETGKNKYNYLQVYIPTDRQSIALEPMTCPPDAFNNKIDLMALAPDEEASFSWGIRNGRE